MKKDCTSHRTAVTEAARRAYKELGSGFVEQVYRDAMAVEFRLLGLYYEVERNIEVFYRGERVGLHRLDFIVERSLVVELKAAAKISEHNFAQTRAYLRTTDLSAALVINFPSPENEDGPEIQFVAPRAHAASPMKRKTMKRPEPKQVGRAAKPQHKRLHPPKKERRPVGDLVWNAVARRYVDKHPGSIPGVRSITKRMASRETENHSNPDASTPVPMPDTSRD
jgi:GxxExxY protein